MFDGCHYDSSMDSGVVKVIDYNYIPDLKETLSKIYLLVWSINNER